MATINRAFSSPAVPTQSDFLPITIDSIADKLTFQTRIIGRLGQTKNSRDFLAGIRQGLDDVAYDVVRFNKEHSSITNGANNLDEAFSTLSNCVIQLISALSKSPTTKSFDSGSPLRQPVHGEILYHVATSGQLVSEQQRMLKTISTSLLKTLQEIQV
jgi:hypothetical protein